MPVSFGNPGLLFGALAAALPVIIHFLSRRRVRRVPFSDLRFLHEVQARQARSLGVRRWLLLLLRVLAILLVALAAAAPRWGGLTAAGARSVLFVLDTSASMATQTDQGTRLGDAVADCRELIGSLGSEAAVQVVTSGARTGALFAEWLPAGAGAVRGLDAVQTDGGTFDLAAALRTASRQTARAPGAAVDVVLVSDLQEIETGPDLAAAAAALSDAGQVRLLVRRVGTVLPQGGVTDVILPGRVVLAGETVTVRARVRPARTGQVFTLVLDGRPLAEAVATGEAGRPQTLEFAVAVPAPGLHTGVVRKESDVFPEDDERPFVLAVPASIPVLLGHGTDRTVDGAIGRGAWRVLAEALAPGGDTTLFRVTGAPADDLTTEAMAGAGLTVLVDPERLGRQTLQGLRDELDQGGALLVVMGDPTATTYLNATILPLLGLDDEAGYVNMGEAGGQRARVLDRGHPVFAGLPDEAVATLEDVAWRRWFAIRGATSDVPLVLAGEDPLLVAGRAGTTGAGRWALLPFHFRPEASDLPGSPMALPLLRRLCTWLARPAELAAVANLVVGADLRLRPLRGVGAASPDDASSLWVVGPAPGLRRQAQLEWRGATAFLSGGPADAAGFAYFLAGRDTVGIAAVALPAAESNPLAEDAAVWSAPLRDHGLAVTEELADEKAEDVVAAFAGTALAPWLLAAAALVLALELALGRGADSRA